MNLKRYSSLACLLISLSCISPLAYFSPLSFLSPLERGGGRKYFTSETFGTITAGMPEEKILEILGKPSEMMQALGARRLFWESKEKYYSISFGDGKVIEPLAHVNKDDYRRMKSHMQSASLRMKYSSGEPAETFLVPADLPKIQPRAKFALPRKLCGGDRAVRLSSDGKRIAVAYVIGKGRYITQIWEISAKPKVIAEFMGSVIELSPSGKRVICRGSHNPNVYDIDSKTTLTVFPKTLRFEFFFFRDENTVVSTRSSDDFSKLAKGKILQWDIAKNADAGSFEVPDARFLNAFLAKNSKELWLFMSKNKFEVDCYDLDSKKLVRTVKPESDETGKAIYR